MRPGRFASNIKLQSAISRGPDPVLKLQENGRAVLVNNESWASGTGEAIELLAEGGVVGLSRFGEGVLVTPGKYVGQLRSARGSVQIEPKIGQAAFTALLRLARPTHARDIEQAIPDETSEREDTETDVVDEFLVSLATAVTDGLPIQYETLLKSLPAPRGRIDFGTTLRKFASSGIYHRVACMVPSRTVNADVLMVISAAAEVLLSDHYLDQAQLSYLDSCMMQLPNRRRASAAEALAAIPDMRREHDSIYSLVRLLESARRVLLGEDSALVQTIDGAAGSGRFHDSDGLWEKALYNVFATATESTGLTSALHPWRGTRTPLFPDGGPDVDPDVLVLDGERVHIVVDAKNKITQSPVATDVYQIVSYARRTGASHAALIYMTMGPGWQDDFGDAELQLRCVGLPIADLEQACAAMARDLSHIGQASSA